MDFDPKPLSGRLLAPLEAWLAHPPWHLRFPAELEDFYEQETGAMRRRWLVMGGLVGTAAFLLFSLTDSSMFPESQGVAMRLRLEFFLPLSLAFLVAIGLQTRPWLRELLDACLSLTAQACIVLILLQIPHPHAAYYVFGIPFVALYSLTIARLRFPFALGSAILVSLAFVVILPHIPSIPVSTHSFQLAFVTASMGLGLFANHATERTVRTSYLQFLAQRLQQEHLSRDNAALSVLAGTDPLTSLANRRSFDDFLAARAVEGKGCALILMDIDHFKAYNDTYGHQAGDICLQVFAGNLRLNLRGQDFVARVGGEEFAMVLPGTDRDEAVRVTEHLRESFREFRLPHESSPTAAFLTFSAGIALCFDSCPPDRLYAHADAALYKAKAQGRDRWVLETFSGLDETRTIFIP